jgi:ubiquinone/menaquinone biosynthesis C-methylase UbiE
MTSFTPPPHQNLNDPNWQKTQDWGGFFPSVAWAQEYAQGVATSKYHDDRLRALKHIIASIPANTTLSTILDYGIGDGGEFMKLGLKPKTIIGTDISPHMIDLAASALSQFEFQGHVGSANAMSNVASSSVDLVLCLNVLGYLTDSDQEIFFKETQRVLKSGGYLLVMTGNELFDLFALNAGTAEFFEHNFSQPFADKLLIEGKALRFKNADRRNPLKFVEELSSHGFKEVSKSFSQWHKKIPALANIEFKGDLLAARSASRDHDFDPNNMPKHDRWKALFCCSIFASLSIKI